MYNASNFAEHNNTDPVLEVTMNNTSKSVVSPELLMKRNTLIAWARILYKNGMIDLNKLNRMISEIEKLQK